MKILLVDDHQLIRDGLRSGLKSIADASAEVVEILEVDSYPEAVAAADGNPDLDVILLDLRLPNVIGFAALIDLQERHPHIPVIIMSALDDSSLVREALERGARGYIPKTSASAVIMSAIRLVLSGGTYIPKEILPGRPEPEVKSPDTASSSKSISPAELGLTERQTEVLVRVLNGESNKMICRDLNVSEGTVKNHVGAILKAFHVTTRVQAVVEATKLGLKIGK